MMEAGEGYPDSFVESGGGGRDGGQISSVRSRSGSGGGGGYYLEGFRKFTHDSSQRNYRRKADATRSPSASPMHYGKEEERDEESNGEEEVHGGERDAHKEGGGPSSLLQLQRSNGPTSMSEEEGTAESKEQEYARVRERVPKERDAKELGKEPGKELGREVGKDAGSQRPRERDGKEAGKEPGREVVERERGHYGERDERHKDRERGLGWGGGREDRERETGWGGGGREGEREERHKDRERESGWGGGRDGERDDRHKDRERESGWGGGRDGDGERDDRHKDRERESGWGGGRDGDRDFYRQRNRGFEFQGSRGGRGWGGGGRGGGDRGREGYRGRDPPHDRERLYGGGFGGRKRDHVFEGSAAEEHDQHGRNKRRGGEWNAGEGGDRNGNRRDGQTEGSLERSRWFDHRDRGRGGERDQDTGRKWERMEKSSGDIGSGAGSGNGGGGGSSRGWESNRGEDQGGYMSKAAPFSSWREKEGGTRTQNGEVGRMSNVSFKREQELDNRASGEQRRDGRRGGEMGERDSWANRTKTVDAMPVGRGYGMDGKEDNHPGRSFSSARGNNMGAVAPRDRGPGDTWAEKGMGSRSGGIDRQKVMGTEDRPGKSSRWGPEAQQSAPMNHGNAASSAGVKTLQEAVNAAIALAHSGQGCGMTEEQQHSAQLLAARKAAELVNRNLGVPGSMSAQEKKRLLWGAKKPSGELQEVEVACGTNRWDAAHFSDPSRQQKFAKLMGLKGGGTKSAGTDGNISSENSDKETYTREATGHSESRQDNIMSREKQLELQLELEKQYTVGLRRRDGRTVGLGL
ncbi:hypothetical protein CBR_g50470 [Chara braunii]|uniref:Small acidic protein-like domain-containing protein n=1 Tax=Chara braunii TaxID=69332 RepID=A0A388M768_CHABU|nr:hypothetical protein CBR_g50470 [Chara braunii]|eukprot:GBG90292.1 hypothetical protein CBR_g50470 [Chara braunii]